MITIIIFIIIVYLIYINCNREEFKNNIELNNLNLDNNINNNIDNNFIIENKNMVPNIICKNDNIKELIYDNFKYKIIGKAVNKYYNQEYYLYESRKDQYGNLLIRDNLDYLNSQIYSYLFITFNDNQQIIEKEFGPRSKINSGDIIYIGVNNIGPYIIL
jgi:hypothetical protein